MVWLASEARQENKTTKAKTNLRADLGFLGFKCFLKGLLAQKGFCTHPAEGARCHEPRSTTIQTVVAHPVDVVIPDWTASEQLDMSSRQFARAFARPFGRSDTSACGLYGVP